MNSEQSARGAGFTLVELLVVIAILGVLAAALIPAIGISTLRAQVGETKAEIQRLSTALDTYASQNGDYPWTFLSEKFEFTAPNAINPGIESAVAELSNRDGGPYFEFIEERLSNHDADAYPDPAVKAELNSVFNKLDLFEYCDSWGNPYIYFHNRDYERLQMVIQGEALEPGPVNAGTSLKTGSYFSATGFQVWSCGPDLESQNGDEESDDIGSW